MPDDYSQAMPPPGFNTSEFTRTYDGGHMNADGETRDRLTRIEGKIDLIGIQHSASETVSRDHEERLRALEKWKYALPLTLIGALVAAAGSVISAIQGP